MRLIPLLTAILVTAGLFFAVFQREALLAFARNDAAAEQLPAPEPDGDGMADAVAAAAETSGAIGVVVMRSAAQAIDSAVVLRGETRAVRQVEVRAETAGTVLSEPLRKGAHITKGELLCQLDPGVRDANLAEARARLVEAKSRVPEAQAKLVETQARLAEAQINLNAAQKLSEGGYASETRRVSAEASERAALAGIASAEAGLEATASGIEAAEAAVAAAEWDISRLAIRAPFNGLLETDTAELGSFMQPGSLCGTVIQLNPIKVVGFVPESEVNRVIPGALAGAELSTGERITGHVTFLSRSADPTTRTFEVEITVPNEDLSIRDGQTADIAISSAGANAHKVPQSALTLNNAGVLGVRTVGPDNVVDFIPVKLLRDEVDGVWLDGLPETADIIVVGQDFVTKGVAVAPTLREATQ
ncbi:efflux RND transporter periplasmic adaptor subunit [Aliisedimentitalea scapharcae]|uniref:Efflux RND transporter periplasmic adaptor subunit n=1 Tax=Aliisedimentitalea scapharcae TaxID=1524259 RepID=A0ABZ2XX63_9RHOB